MRRQFVCASLALLVAVGAMAAELPQGVYTEAQASAGKPLYDIHCSECHHLALRGTGHGPELAGPDFLAKWGNQRLAALYALIDTTMPAGAPHSLKPAEYTAILAHVLRVNGAAPGERTLHASLATPVGEAVQGKAWDASRAEAVREDGAQSRWVSWSAAGTISGDAVRAQGFVNRELNDYQPVTEAMLRDPPPGDWLHWRRTQDSQGYSPLDRINRRNVGKLRLAWALTMREGSNQVTPLVHDGVMFLTHPGNVIQAVDAASGELIWEYAYDFPPESRTLGGPTKNIALYGDKLFLATYDAALVAVDARTGRQLWRAVKADYRKGYTHTAGPFVADGVVISGINGCERYKPEGCFITGHDPDTGRELWRTSTIALPGDPNDASWGGIEPTLRAGGDVWMAGSYDPERKLFYVGTSQAKPWVAASRGMSALDAALYTNSTLAIEPRTGRIAWYYQHVPGETLDMEVGFERVLVDLDGRALVVTIGKDGILWKLDRGDGRFAGFAETIYQNLFLPLDHGTGRLRYRQDIVEAKLGDPMAVCPGIYGGHNWQSTAYSPEEGTLIVPLHQLCAELVGRKVTMAEGEGGYGGESRVYEMPGANGMLGRLASWDLRTMKEVWSHKQRAMFLTGVLTTRGGLSFVGDVDRYFKAFDTRTGELLWQTRLGAALHGFPVSYAVKGRQYIAVPAGMGVFKLLTAKQSPEIYQPNGGNELYVFELP
jgi:alcohol dehydrogenase (cytochrome c)